MALLLYSHTDDGAQYLRNHKPLPAVPDVEDMLAEGGGM